MRSPAFGIVFAATLSLGFMTCGAQDKPHGVLTAGFVCTQGVYNTELMAPWDVLQHSVYRDSTNYIRCVIVSADGAAVRTAEGLVVQAHHSFDDAPPLDIVIVPSSEHSMGADLANARLVSWLRERVERARWVLTLCDGAFPLAATGALDGRVATTFPADREDLARRFPAVQVRHDVRLVVDGKYLTSVGGVASYEPAFYLVDRLYGKAHAERTGEGLVFTWDPDRVPHAVIRH